MVTGPDSEKYIDYLYGNDVPKVTYLVYYNKISGWTVYISDFVTGVVCQQAVQQSAV